MLFSFFSCAEILMGILILLEMVLMLRKKVPNPSQHLKCCINSIFLLWGGPNAPLLNVTGGVKALLLWGLISVNLLI